MAGEIRSFPDKKNPQGIYRLQTGSASDAKGSALRKGRKRVRERGTQVQRK